MAESDGTTHEYRIKCRNCGLHYSVYSWDEKWDEKGREGGYCPECGIGGSKMVWGPVTHVEPIFHFIPGEAGGGVKIENGVQTPVEGAPLKFTAPASEAPFGIPKYLTEPN